MIRFAHLNIRCRSCSGTPMISASVISGSSSATSAAKSHSPRSHTSSTSATARRRIISENRPTRAGVNAPDTVRRSRLCVGGSMFSIICRVKSRSSGAGSRSWVQPAQAENTSGVRLTCRTSSYRVTAQKPGPAGQPRTLGSCCQDTGSVPRSSA